MSDNGGKEDDGDDELRMQVGDKMRIEGTRRKIETEERENDSKCLGCCEDSVDLENERKKKKKKKKRKNEKS